MYDDGLGFTKKREDDCDMLTSLQAPALSKAELFLHEAARTNQDHLMKKILSDDAADINAKNHLDRTPLHMAASQGHKEACEVLKDSKANLDIADKFGMTPLLWAAYFGHLHIVKTLIDTRGRRALRRNKQGMHCLHIAAQQNNVELLNYLIAKVRELDLNDTDINSRTPLLIAAANGSCDIAEMLTKYEDEDEDNREKIEREVFNRLIKIDKEGKNVIHHATINGKSEVLEYFINLAECALPKGNPEDAERLEATAQASEEPRSKKLTFYSFINEKDASKKTPLHYGCEMGNSDAVKALVEAGVDVNYRTGINKELPLHIVISNKKTDLIAILMSASEACNVNKGNASGNSPLHLAALADDSAAIEKLLAVGANLETRNKREQTALHAAVEQNKANAVETLLLHGADLTPVDKTGKTPLVLATQGSYIAVVDMIIKAERYRDSLEEIKERRRRSQYSLHSEESTFSLKDIVPDEDEDEDEEDDTAAKKFRLKVFNQDYAEGFKTYLWNLAYKHMRSNEWKKLAFHWTFKREHIAAIEHQTTHAKSYKEQAYRMLCIWFHGLDRKDTPIRDLYSALTAIGRRPLADKIRKDLDILAQTLLEKNRKKKYRHVKEHMHVHS